MATERIRIPVEMDPRVLICRIRTQQILVIPGVDLDKTAPPMLVRKEVMMDIHEVDHKVGLMAIPVEDHKEGHLKGERMVTHEVDHNRLLLKVERMVTHEADLREELMGIRGVDHREVITEAAI